MSGLGPSFMKIWTCGSARQSGSWNAWMQMKNIWETFGIFLARLDLNDFLSRLVIMDKTWLYHYDWETKQQSLEWQHAHAPKNSECKYPLESYGLNILGSRQHHHHHWLSSKGPNCQRWVLLVSAGAVEGHTEGKCCGKVTKGILFLHNSALAHWGLETQRKLAYLGFQYLDHPPYSLNLAVSDYYLFPELKKQLKGHHFSSNCKGHCCCRDLFVDGQLSEFFLSALQR